LPVSSNGLLVTLRMHFTLSMRRSGFAEVCGPQRELFAPRIGKVEEEKIALPVEMRWYSVVGCNTCG